MEDLEKEELIQDAIRFLQCDRHSAEEFYKLDPRIMRKSIEFEKQNERRVIEEIVRDQNRP